MENDNIDLLSSIIRNIDSEISKKRDNSIDYTDYHQKKWNFKKWEWIIKLRHWINLIEQTSLAISNFMEFKLEWPTKISNDWEKYLRLYGHLNAIYLQKSSIIL